MKNFKAISMDCNEEQFESIEQELIELGCDIQIFNDFDECQLLVNNTDGNNKEICNLFREQSLNHKRTYIGAFDKEAFLQACGKVEEVNELPKKWYVKHTPEALDWIRVNAEKNGTSINEINFYMMPSNSAGNNSSEFKPKGYTFLSNDLFEKLVLGSASKQPEEVKKSGWYVDSRYPLFLAYSDFKSGVNFGFSVNGIWTVASKRSEVNFIKENTNATPEQVLQRLTEEAEKRGYKNGVKVIDLNKVEIVCRGSFVLGLSGELHFGGATIMKDGIWADIVADEIEVVDPVEIGIEKIEFSPAFEVMDKLKKEKTTLLKSRNRYKQLYGQEKSHADTLIKDVSRLAIENNKLQIQNAILEKYISDKKEANEELYKMGCQVALKNDDLKKEIKQTNIIFWIVIAVSISYVILTLC